MSYGMKKKPRLGMKILLVLNRKTFRTKAGRTGPFPLEMAIWV